MIDKLGVVLLIFYTVGGASGLLCAPSCSNDTGVTQEGQKVPNPSDCFQYYVCSDVNGDNIFELSDEALDCPEGTYFDKTAKNCKAVPTNGDAYCNNLCSPCAVACSSPGETVPDPNDCASYYVCLSGGEIDYVHVTCESGQLYDFTKGSCQDPETARCFDDCDPCKIYCVLEGRIPDPFDCRGYLYCEPPDQTATFHCAGGEIYNPAINECEKGDSCKNSCDGGGGSSTTESSSSDGFTTTTSTGFTTTTSTTAA